MASELADAFSKSHAKPIKTTSNSLPPNVLQEFAAHAAKNGWLHKKSIKVLPGNGFNLGPPPPILHKKTIRSKPIAAPTDSTLLSIEQLSTKMRPSVVAITVKDQNGNPLQYGSGVVIDSDIVATCYHVIQGGSSVTINFANGKSSVVYGVMAAGKAADLALLIVDTAGIANAKLEFKVPNLGAAVVAIGSPEGLSGTVSSGIVSSVRKDSLRNLIQTTAPISPGSSGGALFDMHGNLVGITSNYMPDGENLNFAISTSDLAGVSLGFDSSLKDVAGIFGTMAVGQLPTAPSAASEPAITEKPLNGVLGVAVLTVEPSADAVADGITTQGLKNQVEVELRKNGVPVDDPLPASHGHGLLYINPNLLKLTDGNYAYSIDVNFNEEAILSRIPPVQTSVETWRTGYTGYAPKDQMGSVMSEEAIKMVDSFCSAYLAQNPKN
jgi:S1-C subfamily serine protease